MPNNYDPDRVQGWQLLLQSLRSGEPLPPAWRSSFWVLPHQFDTYDIETSVKGNLLEGIDISTCERDPDWLEFRRLEAGYNLYDLIAVALAAGISRERLVDAVSILAHGNGINRFESPKDRAFRLKMKVSELYHWHLGYEARVKTICEAAAAAIYKLNRCADIEVMATATQAIVLASQEYQFDPRLWLYYKTYMFWLVDTNAPDSAFVDLTKPWPSAYLMALPALKEREAAHA